MEKQISGEQRKMLSKLYEKQISERISQANTKRNEEQKELEKQILLNESGKLGEVYETWRKLKTAEEEARKKLEELTGKNNSGFTFYGYREELEVSGSHPKVDKFTDETRAIQQKMEQAKDEIMMDIWGLSGGYKEIIAAIDAKFKALGV